MNIMVNLRAGTLVDIPEIIRLYAQTVLTVCTEDYDSDQLRTWARLGRDPLRWEHRLHSQFFRVAEIGNCLVGFASLTDENYLDVFYVSKDHQRMGVASKLFDSLLTRALNNGIAAIFADVSKTAKPYFERLGFRVIREQENVIEGIVIINYRMEKLL